MLSLIALEHGFEIKHKILCPRCDKPLKLYLHENKYGNADCINLQCGMIGFNSIGGSIGGFSPKYWDVRHKLFSKEYKKLFKTKSRYWDLLPKYTIIKLWLNWKYYRIFAPILRPYYNWRSQRMLNKLRIEIKQLEDEEQAIKEIDAIDVGMWMGFDFPYEEE